jgi:hypothetical protein
MSNKIKNNLPQIIMLIFCLGMIIKIIVGKL